VRIESVTAVAFGPFRGVTLTFSPQLTIIYGPNEAGKSSWHAAIYAALCGMRRGRGQPRLEDRAFTDRHRPWRGDAWEVRSLVRLDDGRRVELRQNLSDLAHCSATDADLGRDISGEILNDGTPDAAKWLGLDRQSFLSVACVRQAEIQAVSKDAQSLQDELQRAAASVAGDATAAQAIAGLEDFLREHVGQDRANSTKPLQRAKVRLAAAETAVAHAREKHAKWLNVEAEALRLQKIASDEEQRVRMLQALRARTEAEAWRARLNRAQELAARYATGPVPILPEEELLTGDVAASLNEWENRPEVAVLTGPSVTAIRMEIDALPSLPTGDQVPQPEVVAAMKAYDHATQAFGLHERQRPSTPHVIDAKGLTADQLRELARALETSIPNVDSGIENSYREARDRLEAVPHQSAQKFIGAGLAAAAVLTGAALWAFSNRLIGAVLVVSGVTAFVWLVLRSGEARRARALEEVGAVEAQVLSQRKAVDDAREQLKEASERAIAFGLPADPKALRELADGLVLTERNQQTVADWSTSHEALHFDVITARQLLEEALRQRGTTGVTDPVAAYLEYERACHLRAEQAARASRRQSLEHQFSDRYAAEQAARDAETRRLKAEEKILATLARCRLEAPDQATAVEELRRWQAKRNKMLTAFDEATREYAELEALLAGGTLHALESQCAERQQRAAELEAALGQRPELAANVNLDEEVRRAERVAHEAAHKATEAETQARERANDVPSIPEAEEALAAAQSESERIRRLGRTLNLTLDFLRRAEERVHRDIAPVLAAGLRQWLADVTQGRYTDARVDPSDLCVQVLGPDSEWHNAQHLSHGTAEQIYLLLRVVLAERLTTACETCPLLLDDVFVHCDRVRKPALLNVMLAVSRTRQVILLTQEEEVPQWAQHHLASSDELAILPGAS